MERWLDLIRGYRGWIEGGEIEAVTFNGRPVRVFSIHCPPGEHGYIRTMHDIIDRLRPHARTADLVLGGDFNVAVGFRGLAEAVRMSRATASLPRTRGGSTCSPVP